MFVVAELGREERAEHLRLRKSRPDILQVVLAEAGPEDDELAGARVGRRFSHCPPHAATVIGMPAEVDDIDVGAPCAPEEVAIAIPDPSLDDLLALAVRDSLFETHNAIALVEPA